MKRLKQLVKMIFLGIVSLLLLVVVVGFIFIKTSKQFGAAPTAEQIAFYETLDHYEKGAFKNLDGVEMKMGFSDMINMIPEYFKKIPNREPQAELPREMMDSLEITKVADTSMYLNWFGHSALLLQLHGKKIMIDPMMGPTPAPHPTLGKQRYTPGLPIQAEQLPPLDIVLFSHDHYDHLDYESIQKIKDKTGQFLVPLGLANHLISWGVDSSKIQEFNWWDSVVIDGYTYTCAPAQHFSGRGLGDRGATLWCSWIVQHIGSSIYFSGDSGYGRHFKEIGEKFGPFDFAMMECGQYNEKWKEIHMMPEETAQAAKDIGAKSFMPIHWGSFTLALHSWNDSPKRVTAAAEKLELNIVTPIIGETMDLSNLKPLNRWWDR